MNTAFAKELDAFMMADPAVISDSWADVIKKIDSIKSVSEKLDLEMKGVIRKPRGLMMVVNVGGKDYGYVAPEDFTGGTKEMARKFEKLAGFSKGRALAWLKKNSILVSGSKQTDTGLGPDVQTTPGTRTVGKKMKESEAANEAKTGDDVYDPEGGLIGQIVKIKGDMVYLTRGEEVELGELVWDEDLGGYVTYIEDSSKNESHQMPARNKNSINETAQVIRRNGIPKMSVDSSFFESARL